MTSLKRIAGLVLVVLFAAACGDDEQQQNGWSPTRVAFAPSTGFRAEVVPTSLTPGFYQVRADLRMCMWPYCGGYFVHLVNRGKTECAPGVFATECYVASMELQDLGMNETDTNAFYEALDRVIGFGAIQPRAIPDGPSYRALHVALGFIGASEDTGGGDAFILRTHGDELVAIGLNDRSQDRFGAVDFTKLHVKPAQIALAKQLMNTSGLVATGYSVDAQGCQLPTLVVTQIYIPVGRLGTVGL